MSDDEILGRVLRRFLADEDEWSSTSGSDLILDGRIRLTDEEQAVVDRALHPVSPGRAGRSRGMI